MNGSFPRRKWAPATSGGVQSARRSLGRVSNTSTSLLPPQAPSSTPTPASLLQLSPGRVDKTWSGHARTSKAPGFTNIGNSCFVAATLQSLMHLREYCYYFIRNHTVCTEAPHKCIACALRAMLSWHWPHLELGEVRRIPTPSEHALEPLYNAIIKTMTAVNPSPDLFNAFKEFQQGDAAEFLAYLIDELRDVESPTSIYRISNLFDIEHETEWTCSNCDKIHRRVEQSGEAGHGIGISVNIQQPTRHLNSMISYLRSNAYVEQMEIRCDSELCQDTREANEGMDELIALLSPGEYERMPVPDEMRTRRKFITKAPEIVVIKLARFTATVDENGRVDTEKLNDQVTYPAILDLTEFTRPSSDDGTAQQGQKPLKYKLQSVVAHSGSTLEYGHYVAAVRELDGRSVATFDDEKRRQGYMRDLERPGLGGLGFDPYLLFYSKMEE